MKHSIKIIFGKEQVIKYHQNEPLSPEEAQINLKEFSFNSKKELEAFCLGLDEAVGWMEWVGV